MGTIGHDICSEACSRSMIYAISQRLHSHFPKYTNLKPREQPPPFVRSLINMNRAMIQRQSITHGDPQSSSLYKCLGYESRKDETEYVLKSSLLLAQLRALMPSGVLPSAGSCLEGYSKFGYGTACCNKISRGQDRELGRWMM